MFLPIFNNYHDQEDDKELKEELNELYDEGEDDLEDLKDLSSPVKKRTSTVLKIMTFLVVLAFMTLALGDFFRLLSLPSLDFLIDSRSLREDPLLQELQQSVVQVRVTGEDDDSFVLSRERRGTGFNIRDYGMIVTNRHVISNARAITVSFLGKGTYQARQWMVSPDADLAIILLEEEGLPTVSLEEMTLPGFGEEVFIIGNPLGFPRVMMQGNVEGYRHDAEGTKQVMEIKAPIHRGSSGSPVFNEKGQVVGVVYAAIEASNNEDIKGLAVPVSRLHQFLDSGQNINLFP